MATPYGRGRTLCDRDRGWLKDRTRVARLLAANGAAVVVADVNEAGAKSVADEIRAAGGTAVSLAGNVT